MLSSSQPTEKKHEIFSCISANDTQLHQVDFSQARCGYSFLKHHESMLDQKDVSYLIAGCQTNSHLRSLNLEFNLLGDELIPLLSVLVHLTELNIAGNLLSHLAGAALLKCAALINLNVNYNHLGVIGAQQLAAHPSLVTLSIVGNQIENDGIKSFIRNGTLHTLNAGDNQIDAQGAMSVALNGSITDLNLCNNFIGNDGALALGKNAIFRKLDISYNEVQYPGMYSFRDNTSLQELSLAYNQIRVEGAKILSHNSTLKRLNLAGNMINNEGITSIGSNNTSLQSLNLSFNQINDDGLKGLNDLSEHIQLTELDLSFNQITLATLYPLAKNKHLYSLSLAYNLIGDLGASVIAQNESLQVLDLTANQIGFDGAYALSQNNSIKTLKICFNMLGDAGAIILAQNKHLEVLISHYNQISDPGVKTLKQSGTLRHLEIQFNPMSDYKSSYISVGERPFMQTSTDYKGLISLLAQDFICICDPNGYIVFFNSTVSRVFGYSSIELLGTSVINMFHPEDREAAVKELAQTTKFPHTMEIRCLCKSGTIRTLRWSSQLKHNYFYIIGMDVTSAKKSDLLLKKEEERHFEERVRQGTEFISQVCHEIRNPLTGLMGLTEEMATQVDQLRNLISSLPSDKLQEGLKVLDQMHESITQMKLCHEYQRSVLDDNLDLSKLTEQKLILLQQPFNLITTIQEVILMLKTRATQKHLKLTTEMPPLNSLDLSVVGDAGRLKQILINLVGNAIKFTEKGSIVVRLLLPPTWRTDQVIDTQMEVIDTGIGIKEEEIKDLFQRFTSKSQWSMTHPNGSGLGLYLCKAMIELMGGKIVAESNTAGSTFRFNIPFRRVVDISPGGITSHDINTDIKEISEYPNPLDTEALNNKCILVVEDNLVNIKLLNNILQEWKCRPLLAHNGIEAIEMFTNQAEKINLILMDMIMPRMGGVEATKQIRQIEANKMPEITRRIPIIAITGQCLVHERNEMIEAGVDVIVSKPYSRVDLLRTLVNVIGSST